MAPVSATATQRDALDAQTVTGAGGNSLGVDGDRRAHLAELSRGEETAREGRPVEAVEVAVGGDHAARRPPPRGVQPSVVAPGAAGGEPVVAAWMPASYGRVAGVWEVGVPQADAVGDPAFDLLAQRASGDLLYEQPCDDVVGVAVGPPGPRREVGRVVEGAVDEFPGFVVAARIGEYRVLVQVFGESAGVLEELADRDGPAVDAVAAQEARKMRFHWLVEGDLTLADLGTVRRIMGGAISGLPLR
ncbi:protein of unknown function [Streptomyces sp. KY75]|nr:protein of unknown function [Streptomyces sp. KY75]CAD5991339.1 protein of unknown function [Streptomyces sp. KY70]